MRGLIVGATASGQSGTRIAEHLNIPRSTVYDTLHLDFARNDGQSRVRRPKAYTDLDLGKLLRHVQLHPTETYEQIKNALGLPYSATTIKAMLKAHGVTHKRIASSQKRFVKNSSPAVAVSAAD
jgi:transposase